MYAYRNFSMKSEWWENFCEIFEFCNQKEIYIII